MSACEQDSSVVKDYVDETNGRNPKDSMGQGAGNPSFLAVDFFCGGGGTTRGLIDADGYIIAGVDKVKTCRETYLKNNVNRFIDYSPPRFLGFDLFPEVGIVSTGRTTETDVGTLQLDSLFSACCTENTAPVHDLRTLPAIY